MKFEYDIEKSKINKQKHGIDFEEAKTLFVTDNVVLPAISKEIYYEEIKRDNYN
ncbi:MAG: hypothetical protein ABII25_03100 [bacterium]